MCLAGLEEDLYISHSFTLLSFINYHIYRDEVGLKKEWSWELLFFPKNIHSDPLEAPSAYPSYAVLDNLDNMGKFLKTYNLPKPNQEESENLNRQITLNEFEAVIK